MTFRRFALAAALLAPALAAQSVSGEKALTAACCEKFLTELVYYQKLDNIGVPAYTMNMGDMTYSLSHGSSFTVSDGAGQTEEVVFDAADFADIGAATMDEVMDAINAQVTGSEAMVDSGMLMLRGLQGGPDAELTLAEGTGGALATLGFAADTMMGAEDVELKLITDVGDAPMENHLAGHTYMLVMSTTAGETQAAGQTVPLAIDATTLLGLRALQFGLLPSFMGTLDQDGAAHATFDTALLKKMFPAGAPDELYFSFVVFDPGLTSLEFASNRFDAVIED